MDRLREKNDSFPVPLPFSLSTCTVPLIRLIKCGVISLPPVDDKFVYWNGNINRSCVFKLPIIIRDIILASVNVKSQFGNNSPVSPVLNGLF